MDKFDAIFLLGFAAFEVGLWIWSPALALAVGGALLMSISIVLPARLGAQKSAPKAEE